MNLLNYFVLIAKEELTEVKELIVSHRWLTLGLLMGLFALFAYLRPFPPGTAVIAAGSKDSSYWNTSKDYARYFEANGVKLELIETAGSVDSGKILSDPKTSVDIALIQGGALDNIDTKRMQSLGSIAYEPLWIFYHKDLSPPPRHFTDLFHYRVGMGPRLGGTRKLLSDVLQLNDMKLEDLKGNLDQSYRDNTKDFYARKLDIVVKVANYNDPEIQELLNDQNIAVMPIPHAEAYQKNLPYINAFMMPASSVDIAKNIPAEPIPLIVTTTSLVVDKNLHPDLQMLLLVTARDLQRSSQNLFFSKRDEFPAYVDPTIEISPTASYYYDHGTPPGWHYLPFWLAGFFSRIWIVALSIFAIAYPISKLNIHLREKNYHLKHHSTYHELVHIEQLLCEKELSKEELYEISEKIDRLNKAFVRVRVPTGTETKYFELLSAINILKGQVKERLTIDQ